MVEPSTSRPTAAGSPATRRKGDSSASLRRTRPGTAGNGTRREKNSSILLSGRIDIVQEIDGADHVVALRPGDAMINPTNVWHTARVHEPGVALFVTPGDGHRAPTARLSVSEPEPGRAGPAAGTHRRRGARRPTG